MKLLPTRGVVIFVSLKEASSKNDADRKNKTKRLKVKIYVESEISGLESSSRFGNPKSVLRKGPGPRHLF